MSQRHSHANKIKNKNLPTPAYLAFLQIGFFFLFFFSSLLLSPKMIMNLEFGLSYSQITILKHLVKVKIPSSSQTFRVCFFFRLNFFSAVLGLQQNWDGGTQIAQKYLPPKYRDSPIINTHQNGIFVTRKSHHWHSIFSLEFIVYFRVHSWWFSGTSLMSPL